MTHSSIPPQPPMTDDMAGRYLQVLQHKISHPAVGDKGTCLDCGRPQHYTGTEYGWAHDALVDTWHCADPRKAGA